MDAVIASNALNFLSSASSSDLGPFAASVEPRNMVDETAERLTDRIKCLSAGQLTLLSSVVDTFETPIQVERNSESDVVDDVFAAAFGEFLKLHHALSDRHLGKERFESGLARIKRTVGHDVSLASNCNPGCDLTIDNVPWSLKSQADKNIKPDRIWISKFMELGKGRWEDESDLERLRDSFLEHLENYERILMIRYFVQENTVLSPTDHYYELVEIPKALLSLARDQPCEMRHNSKQSPKPGYCRVKDPGDNREVFQLYFDGGTERKLQIKNLLKERCVVHAHWEF